MAYKTRQQIYQENLARRAGYLKSPAQRRAEAQERLRAEQAAKQAQAQEVETKIKTASENVNPIWRTLSTVNRVRGKVATGALGAIEGLVDTVIGIGGAIGGVFDDDIQEGAQKIIAYNATEEWVGKHINELTKYSYTEGNKVGEIIEGVASGVGQMLPTVAAAAITGGASLGATASQAVSLGVTATSAAGNAMQDAYNDGADYYQGLAYGATSGALEAVTEKLSGGTIGRITGVGKGFADDALKNVGKTGIARIAKEAVGEGVEEMITEAASPALKSIYKGREGLREYGTLEFYGQVGEAGLVGALTSVAFGQTVGRATLRGGNADINEALESIREIDQKTDKRIITSDLTERDMESISRAKGENYRNIEQVLKKMDGEKRAKMMTRYGFDGMFDSDGTLRADFAASNGFSVSDGKVVANTQNRVTEANLRYVAPSLRNNRTRIAEDLAAINERRSEGSAPVAVFGGTLSAEGEQAYSRLKAAVAKLNRKANSRINVTVVTANPDFHGVSVQKNNIYIAADVLENTALAEQLAKQVEQTEQTEQDTALDNFAEVRYNRKQSEEIGKDGAEYGTSDRQDPEILGGSALRREGGSGNGTRQQGENPEEIYQRLANDQADGRGRTKKRIGSSGWYGKYSGRQSNLLRSATGVLRDIRRRSVKGTDTAGRTVSESIRNQFAQTVCKDESGALLSLFHWTDADFETFSKGDVGFHFGTLDAAHMRSLDIYRKKNNDQSIYKEVYLNIQNPAVIDTDVMSWHVFPISYKLNQQGIITDSEIESLASLDGFYLSKYDSPASVELRRILKAKGYDGILYSNDIEGDLSMIAFYPEQIYTVSENGEALHVTEKKSKAEQPSAKKINTDHAVKTLIHETTHFEEGTPEYYEFIRFLAEDERLIEETIQMLTEEKTGYGFTKEQASVAMQKFENGEKLTEAEREFISELNAHASEKLLGGSQAFIEKLIRGDSTLAERVLGRITDAKAALESHRSPTARGQYLRLKRAEQLYMKAFSAAGMGYYNGKITVREEEEKQKIQYCMKTDSDTGEQFVVVEPSSIHELMKYDGNTLSAKVRNYLKQYRGTVLPLSTDGRVYMRREGEGEYTNPAKVLSEEAYQGKLNAASEFQNLLSSSKFVRHQADDGRHPDAVRGWDYYELKYVIPIDEKNVKAYKAEIQVKLLSRGNCFYDITKIEDITDGTAGQALIQAAGSVYKSSANSIPDSSENVNTEIKFSRKENAETDFLAEAKRSNEKVTMTKGQMEKQRANLYGEKVFSKKDVAEAVNDIEILERIGKNIADRKRPELEAQLAQAKTPKEKRAIETRIKYLEQNAIAEMRNRLTDHLWTGFNQRRDSQAYENYAEIMYKKIHAEFMSETNHDMDTGEVWEMDRQIGQALRTIIKSGKLSKYETKMLETTAAYWRDQYRQGQERTKLLGTLMNQTQKLKELKLGAFLNASVYKSDMFKSTIEQLSRINYRGNLNVMGTRKLIADLLDWYQSDNPMLGYVDEANTGYFRQEVADAMRMIAEDDKGLSNQELQMLGEVILPHCIFIVENFNKVYREGKYIEAMPLAKMYVKKLQAMKHRKDGFIKRYQRIFGDPASLMRYADGYDPNGFFTQTFEELREGAIGASVTERELLREFEAFLHGKGKGDYRKHLEKDTVTYLGKEMSVRHAICLYMTHKRKQAVKGLCLSGIELEIDGNRVRLPALIAEDGKKHSAQEMQATVDASAAKLLEQFSEQDKKLIEIMEKSFTKSSTLKEVTDKLRFGFSNVLKSGYYFPIRRAKVAHTVDNFFAEVDRATHIGFNKGSVQGAAGALLIEPIDTVFTRHMRGIAMYANLAIPIDNLNRLLNLNTGNNHNLPLSVLSEIQSTALGTEMFKYLKELKESIEGGNRSEQSAKWFNRAVGHIRSGFAKFQLGANAKVLITQTSSLFAATSMLDYDCVVKGLAIQNAFAEVDTYCPLAMVRNSDNTVALAQGVLDKTGKVGDIIMKPIGMADRFVVTRLFGACQYQIEKNGGAKVGTVENKQAAGELLKKVILETQQNALATERSAAMRSSNELLRSLPMFTADAMKVFGRVLDSFGEVKTLRALLKNPNISESERDTVRKRLKEAERNLRKSVGALMTNALYMALIAYFFQWLYRRNKDEEPEEQVLAVALDFVGNMIGGLPILNDVYSYFTDGYEVSNFFYSALNDTLEGANALKELAMAAASGEEISKQDIASSARKAIYAACQLLGLPVRNAYNLTAGIIGHFSPSAGYWLDDLFYKKSYRSDLKEAIENEDEKMIATVAGLLTDANIGGQSKTVRAEVSGLVAKGYTGVLPRSLGDTVTYDGEQIELTKAQKKQFRKIYDIADESIETLVTLSLYREAEDSVKAKAIRWIYDTYYFLAMSDVLGIESSKNVLLAEAIDIEKLAIILCTARSIEADKDRSGKPIQGSRKKKIIAYIESMRLSAAQKHIVLGSLGYKQTQGRDKVQAYINTLNLTADEKKELLKYSGYAA